VNTQRGGWSKHARHWWEVVADIAVDDTSSAMIAAWLVVMLRMHMAEAERRLLWTWSMLSTV
jgi:hypothetical protein